MRNFIQFLNPLAQLGKRQRDFFFVFFSNVLLFVLSEIYAYDIAKNPLSVGNYIIEMNVGFILYFSFRDGILGGTTAAVLTIMYYAYIIYTRHFHGAALAAGIDSTITLGIIYLALAIVVGYLKETIDSLIEKEADGRRRLEAIIQQLPVGVLISDDKGKIIQANK